MKKLYLKPISFILLLLLLLSSLSLTSCEYIISLPRDTDTPESMPEEIINKESIAESDPETSGSVSGSDSPAVTESNADRVPNEPIADEDGESSIARATARGLRSAVSVYCTFEVTTGGTSPWNPTPSTQTYYSTGSGVIYRLWTDGSAFIVTNHHVVYERSSNTANHVSDKIYIYLYGLESEAYAIPASYVGGSANYDIAVLRVDQSEVLKNAIATGSVTEVAIANSDTLVPGDTTIAIGNPSSTDLSGISVTQGIVSVDSEYITMTASDNSGEVSFRVIRTDAPVNSGNSGGGLFSDRGELIGIVNAKISSSTVENIGYAIPSNVVRAIADNIIDYCYGKDCETVMRGLLGISISTSAYSTEFDAKTGILNRYEEISVYEVTSGGLAQNILKAGDIIKSITIGDKTVTVTRQHHLIDAMLDVRVGDSVSLVIVRDGTEMTVNTTITEGCLAAY